MHAPASQQPAVRKFNVAGTINSGSRSGSNSAGAASRRFLSHAPLLSQQHRRRPSLDRDPFRRGGAGGDDVIEDGSSPPQTPSQTPQLLDDEGGILMVVRESPTATRTKQSAAAQPPPQPRPGIFSAGARRRKQRSGVDEDIEDVAPSRSRFGSETEDDIVAESGKTLEEAADEYSAEVIMPDSGPSSITIDAGVATPAPLGQTSLTRQQTSAARLLSSIQPLKRRRLFVSPGLITSSPSGAGSDQDNGAEVGGDDEEMEGDKDHERPLPAYIPRFRRKKTRHAWDGDDIVDEESNSSGGAGRYGDEEIRDIVDYGELLEYADSSDDNGHAGDKDEHEIMDDYKDESEDGDDDGEDMILDQTPPRIRRARLRLQQQQQQQQQQEEQKQQEQRQRLPTFQRARLFMSTRKPADDAGEDAGEDPEGEDLPEGAQDIDFDALSQDVATTPARQRHYYDALQHQPPPDFFSPQKKRRQKRTRRSRHSNGDEVGGRLGGLTSPSAAAAAATAAAINAPEQYVPGGLAASLRDWLVQVKSGGGHGATTTTAAMTGGPGRFIVHETRQAPGMMRVALGRRQTVKNDTKGGEAEETGATPLARLLLAGEGRQWMAGRNIVHTTGEDAPGAQSGEAEQSIVSISHPAWEITLGGQPWTVASDWSIHEE